MPGRDCRAAQAVRWPAAIVRRPVAPWSAAIVRRPVAPWPGRDRRAAAGGLTVAVACCGRALVAGALLVAELAAEAGGAGAFGG